MRKLMTGVFALIGLFALTTASFAEGTTPEQAKAFVEKAVSYYKSVGKDQALAAFGDPNGAFRDGELYLVVMDGNDGKLTMLAHGVNKALVGKPQIDMKDAEGRAFNQETAAALAKGDSTWVEFKWPNPVTKKIANKRAYFVKVDGMVIGAGIYN
ncbi:MAG: cache domain-containing protein [Xanthobacteraceae bacterium]